MQTTVRTTIRIRKDLLDQSKLLALRTNTSLQEVVNEALVQGFGYITDLDPQRTAMDKIDKLRQSLKGSKINTKALVEKNKRELQERADRILRNFK
ncbi:MAG: hypothetical protein AAB414_00560 [Patescibacteria group bacterium]